MKKIDLAKYAADPAAFRDDLIVDVDGIARRFGDIQDQWQRDDFAAIDPGLMRCNGRANPNADDAAKMRVYLERPRGHSKTTDLAVTAVWALAFAARPIRGYAYAADKDQAGLLKAAMANILRLNPWLGKVLEVQKSSVHNVKEGHPGYGSELSIEASDVASSWGINPDLIIADELTHWEGDGSLWHSLVSSAIKRTNCLLCVIANAGFIDSWQWGVRETARTDEDWIFRRLEGTQASWFTEKRLAATRRMLPPIAFSRLFENLWSTGGGDALTAEDVNFAFKPELEPLDCAQAGWDYVAGLDLAVSRHASAIVILGVKRRYQGHGSIRLAFTRIWRPSKDKKINLQSIEDAIIDLHMRFRLRCLNYDPWQATHMAQRLSAAGVGMSPHYHGRYEAEFTRRVPMSEVPHTGSNLQAMASTIIEAFNDRRIELYENADLRRDLLKFRVEEKSYGFRLVSPQDEYGHGDTGSAFALAMLAASEIAGKPVCFAGAIDLENPRFGDSSLPDWQRQALAAQREYELEQAELESSDDDEPTNVQVLDRWDYFPDFRTF